MLSLNRPVPTLKNCLTRRCFSRKCMNHTHFFSVMGFFSILVLIVLNYETTSLCRVFTYIYIYMHLSQDHSLYVKLVTTIRLVTLKLQTMFFSITASSCWTVEKVESRCFALCHLSGPEVAARGSAFASQHSTCHLTRKAKHWQTYLPRLWHISLRS